MQKADAAVLGAGIVGLSAALHLQARGREVVIVDRHAAPGRETSFGNAGLIERSSIFPYLFPRSASKLIRYAFNLAPEARYHLSALPTIFPWLWRYFYESGPSGAARSFAAFRPLIEQCLSEHGPLAAAAGAQDLFRPSGWLKIFHVSSTFDAGAREAERLRSFGLAVDILATQEFLNREPHVTPPRGALHFLDTASVTDPAALSQAYLDLFLARGGRFLAGDARTLEQEAQGWRLKTTQDYLFVYDVVVALGPWSDQIYRPLGYQIPLGVKRGYHMNYTPYQDRQIFHPILDADHGFLLAPMARGVRLTTGAEFADRDAPPTPVQIDRCEPLARKLAPLGDRLDPTPWMGARPCLPDMLPVLGPAPAHKGLWFNFGHAHHGLTLGPVTGRLLAEMMTGESPSIDPRPYRADRF